MYQQGFGNQRQGALGADQKPGHVQVIFGQYAGQIVSQAAKRALRLVRSNHVSLGGQNGGHAIDQVSLARVGIKVDALDQRLATQFHHLTVGQHDLQAANVPANRSVFQPSRAGRIDRNKAADRRYGAVGRIGPKDPPPAAQLDIEPLMNQPGLNANSFPIDPDDAAHVF